MVRKAPPLLERVALAIRLQKEGFPTLAGLVQRGRVWFDGSEVVGIADDGQEVGLGHSAYLADCERYLQAYPDPSQW